MVEVAAGGEGRDDGVGRGVEGDGVRFEVRGGGHAVVGGGGGVGVVVVGAGGVGAAVAVVEAHFGCGLWFLLGGVLGWWVWLWC